MIPHLFEKPTEGTVIGYHGTSRAVAAKIMSSGFEASTGDGEWLGHGVYFWRSDKAAWAWADLRHGPSSAAVIRAEVHLGYCIDLDDGPTFRDLLVRARAQLEVQCLEKGLPMPVDQGSDRPFSCALCNIACAATAPRADSVVQVCRTGKLLFPESDLRDGTQLQICIRDLGNILYPRQVHERPA